MNQRIRIARSDLANTVVAVCDRACRNALLPAALSLEVRNQQHERDRTEKGG
jgi:hypothetical protein